MDWSYCLKGSRRAADGLEIFTADQTGKHLADIMQLRALMLMLPSTALNPFCNATLAKLSSPSVQRRILLENLPFLLFQSLSFARSIGFLHRISLILCGLVFEK